MLLAIDIGNSTVRFGVHSGEAWVDHWRVRTVSDKTSDEYTVLFRSLLRQGEIDLDSIDRVALTSVVPPLTGTLSDMAGELFGIDPLIVGPGVKTGLRIRTDNPVEVGPDLVANAVAAFQKFQSSCVAVDFGTALSFTAVAETGDLVGVTIAPGINSAVNSLAQNTAQLPRVRLVPPPSIIGRNTVHSIQAGVIFGYVGMVNAIVDGIRLELPGSDDVKAIATGGQSRIVAPLTDRFAYIDPWLTLDGIRIIVGLND